jgi:hypothetical protein
MTLTAQMNHLIRGIERSKFGIRIQSEIDHMHNILLEKEETRPISGCVSALCKTAAEHLEPRRT